MESWKPVVGFEGLYEVSDEGRVKRVKASPRTRPGFILKPCPTPGKAYLRVCLRRDNENHHRPVHQLVAEAFHGPRGASQVVRHLDGNSVNNQANNLCWGTPKENEQDKVAHGTAPMGTKQPGALLDEERVRLIRSSPLSLNALAAQLGVSRYTVRDVRKRWSWKHVS